MGVGGMKIEYFNNEAVRFVETIQVKTGVVCDAYSFVEDDTKDLRIVTVVKGESTPKQKVLSGDKTEEIFISGKGVLEVMKVSGATETYNFPGGETAILVEIGDVMQWKATDREDLCFAEVCYPPYTEGRFEVVG